MARRALPFPCAWLAVPDRSWRPDGALLTPAEAMVVATFVDRWRRSDDDSFVLSTDDLARLSGLSTRGAETARDSLLERRVLLQVHVGGGRGRPSVYRLGAWSKEGTGNGVTAAETPYENPAASAWLLEKPAPNPAPNPAGFSATGAGYRPATPLSQDQRPEAEAEGESAPRPRAPSVDPRDRAARGWVRGYCRRFESACAIAPSPPAGADLATLIDRALAQKDPDRYVTDALDGFFADPWTAERRFPIGHLAKHSDRYAATKVATPRGRAKPRAADPDKYQPTPEWSPESTPPEGIATVGEAGGKLLESLGLKRPA